MCQWSSRPSTNLQMSNHCYTELDRALGQLAWEAVFVDDSDDGTDVILAQRAQRDARVRVVHRSVNVGGLAGAVVEGLRLAGGTYVCVLDADLQHPPDRIPALLEKAAASDADVVVASRYVGGGSAGGLDRSFPAFLLAWSKMAGRAAFPRQLARVSDPLGGYFLVRRGVVDGVDLRPIGYKILLEILIRCRWDKEAEVPYSFQARQYGSSKADFSQGIRFLRHLSLLLWECSPLFALPRQVARVRGSGGAPDAVRI